MLRCCSFVGGLTFVCLFVDFVCLCTTCLLLFFHHARFYEVFNMHQLEPRWISDHIITGKPTLCESKINSRMQTPPHQALTTNDNQNKQSTNQSTNPSNSKPRNSKHNQATKQASKQTSNRQTNQQSTYKSISHSLTQSFKLPPHRHHFQTSRTTL